jgi:hypothetical protein
MITEWKGRLRTEVTRAASTSVPRVRRLCSSRRGGMKNSANGISGSMTRSTTHQATPMKRCVWNCSVSIARFSQPIAGPRDSPSTTTLRTPLGRWSEAAFARAMHQGVARDGSHLFPAFPYDHFTKVSDADVQALYAYMMSRPARQGRATHEHHSFPAEHPAPARRLEDPVLQ